MNYSVYAYRWANREGRKVGPNAHAILVELVTYANLEDRLCWPSRRALAQNIYDTATPTKSQLNMVSTALSELEQAGLITKEQGRRSNGSNSSNTYELLLPPSVPNSAGHGEPNSTGHGEPNSAGHGEPNSTGRLEVSIGSLQEKSPEERAMDPSGEDLRERVWQRVAGQYWAVESKKPSETRMSIQDYVTAHMAERAVS